MPALTRRSELLEKHEPAGSGPNSRCTPGYMLSLKCCTEIPNVGDQFSLALAERRFSNTIATVGPEPLAERNLLLGGSILQWADARSVVCGSGLLNGALQPFAPPARVTSVRGPLTAQVLRASGISCPDVYGDPGVLAARLYPSDTEPDVALGIVPHYVDAEAPWLARSRASEIVVLDVRQPPDRFLRELRRCEIVMSSSLHGIVFAHAYGRRALWIELSDLVHGDGFKFFDYYASIGVPPACVVRYKVSANCDPWDLANLATPGHSTPLIPGFEGAMAEAASALATA
jgi:pyruvyltransferase